jgi:phosphatidylglycerophosphatase A
MNAVQARRAQKSLRLSLPSSRWSVLIATFFYLGHLPVVGKNTHLGSLSASLIAPFLVWGLAHILENMWLTACLIIAIAATLLGTAALIDVEQHGHPSDHDARAVVIDEIAGGALACLPLALLPEVTTYKLITWLLLAGLVFRVFDITKPYPIAAIDTRWHNPFSVVADDLLAGVYTALIITALMLFIA